MQIKGSIRNSECPAGTLLQPQNRVSAVLPTLLIFWRMVIVQYGPVRTLSGKSSEDRMEVDLKEFDVISPRASQVQLVG